VISVTMLVVDTIRVTNGVTGLKVHLLSITSGATRLMLVCR
jgi:hypothetical protein